jgi:hypothetical protein
LTATRVAILIIAIVIAAVPAIHYIRFAPLKPEQIQGRLAHVVAAENVNITEGGTQAILKLGKPPLPYAVSHAV